MLMRLRVCVCVLEQLPEGIVTDVMAFMVGGLLRQVPFLANCNCDEGFLATAHATHKDCAQYVRPRIKSDAFTIRHYAGPVEYHATGFLKTDDALEGITDVILFAAGSGISPLRATIESGALSDKSVKLYYGCQTPAQMSYSDKFDAWEKLGVDVTAVVSKPDGTDWKGATGYVQDVAKAAGVAEPKSTAILLCGMKGMAEGVKELAAECGIPEERVMANF